MSDVFVSMRADDHQEVLFESATGLFEYQPRGSAALAVVMTPAQLGDLIVKAQAALARQAIVESPRPPRLELVKE